MKGDGKRLGWRCANRQQQSDKAAIYNSREWKVLRLQKLQANPLCEAHLAKDKYVAAHCVHHKVPIETAKTMEELRRLAFDPANLMSLCDECHAAIHKAMGKGTTQLRQERAESRNERWKDKLRQRLTGKTPAAVV